MKNTGVIIKSISVILLIIVISTVIIAMVVNAYMGMEIDIITNMIYLTSTIILSSILFGIGDIVKTNQEIRDQIIDIKLMQMQNED